MKAKVVKVDMKGAQAKLGRIKKDPALGTYASSEAARLMDKYVPFRSGALAGSAKNEPWKVEYTAPYAVYVWNGRGMTFSKQAHPLARSHWSRPLENDPSPLARKITEKLKVM